MSWENTGNVGTSPTVDFLGTTDQQPLVIRTNRVEALRVGSDGKVGMGTTTPTSMLEIVGDWKDGQQGALKLTGDKPSIKFAGGALSGNESWALHLGSRGPGNLEFLRQTGPLAFDHVLTLTPTGRVGLGTSTPSSQMEIVGNWNDGQLGALKLTGDKPSIKFAGGALSGNESWALHLGSRGPGNLEFLRQTGPLAFDHVLTMTPTGRVGIGTSTPSSKLEVIGDISVSGDIRLTNADCAEEFDIAEDTSVEPGSVMVLSEGGELRPSYQAYDQRVAGVISGAGNYKPGIVLDKQCASVSRRPIALMGKVYCRVDAQFGPVEVGDLLTSSPTLGHAMKARDPFKAFGAVIGKALRPLKEGQGLVPILISLQ